MKRLAFALGGTAALALALGGCNNRDQDAVNNAELNQPSADQLNEEANQAAMDAANAQAAAALANQEAQNASENINSPNEAEEQNVSGM